MKKMILLLMIIIVLILTGCGSSNAGTKISEISDMLKERLGISAYIPETDYKLRALVVQQDPADVEEAFYAYVNYYDDSDELTAPDEETLKSFEKDFDREVVYGTLYLEPAVISIEVYPVGRFAGMGDDVEKETIEIAGHEVQFDFIKKGTDREDSDNIFMVIHFEDVSYFIRYSVQSDNIEESAKELAEDIIKNNS